MSLENTNTSANTTSLPPDSPFIPLSAIVLSIEWEITDEILDSLLAEVDKLKTNFSNDKIINAFLQLHGSVGKYIRARKVSAHPESINLLQSVHRGLLKILSTEALDAADRQNVLNGEIDKFKHLKEQIAQTKTAPSSGAFEKPVQPGTPGADRRPETTRSADTAPPEAIAWAVEQLKETIREEFKRLKEELKQTLQP